MTNEDIAVALKDHENEIKSLKHRMDEQEERDKTLTDLTTSVKTLAVNMDYMAREQNKQGKRLERLEREPVENHKHFKQVLISSLVTALIGTIVGALLTTIIH